MGAQAQAHLLQLKPVIAHKQGGCAHVAHHAALVDAQFQLAVHTQQGHARRAQRYPTAAAKAGLERFAVLQQHRVQTQAGIDQKNMAVDRADLHRSRCHLHEHLRGNGRIGRNTVGAREVVKRAQRHHPHHAAGRVYRLGHRVDRAVAPHRDDRRASSQSGSSSFAGHAV